MALPAPSRGALGLATAGLGLAVLLSGGQRAAELRARLAPGLLMIGPSVVAAAPDGTVFVGSAVTSRVHVYRSDGRPVRRWQVPTGGAPFRIGLAAGSVEVAPERGGTLLRYDRRGALLATRADPTAYERLGRSDERAATVEPGIRYAIEGGRLVRSQGGRRRVLVRGFTSHAGVVREVVLVVALLLGGAAFLLGGVLATANRRARG